MHPSPSIVPSVRPVDGLVQVPCHPPGNHLGSCSPRIIAVADMACVPPSMAFPGIPNGVTPVSGVPISISRSPHLGPAMQRGGGGGLPCMRVESIPVEHAASRRRSTADTQQQQEAMGSGGDGNGVPPYGTGSRPAPMALVTQASPGLTPQRNPLGASLSYGSVRNPLGNPLDLGGQSSPQGAWNIPCRLDSLDALPRSPCLPWTPYVHI